MDGAIDIKLILTIGGVLFSVAGASAVAKMQIRQLSDECAQLQKLISALDTRCDRLHTMTETQEQRLNILAKMSSPENLRRDHMSMAQMQADIAFLKDEAARMHKLHNGVHPPVSSERKAT